MAKINPVWARPQLIPTPEGDGFSICLNGAWRFSHDPGSECWMGENGAKWEEVPVPSELSALGYHIRREEMYAYKKAISVPAEWEGRDVILKFGMVYECARVYLDGTFIREHRGAYTSFDCDLTHLAIPGRTHEITVLCWQRAECLCEAPTPKGMKAHGNAGILDDVLLIGLPRPYLTHFHYVTEFDEAFANANLRVSVAAALSGDTELCLRLLDADGNAVARRAVKLTRSESEKEIDIAVSLPRKWSSEDPYLYRLECETESGVTFCRNVGFRSVMRQENDLYVNGVKTRLRGAAIYSQDPLRGKVFTREQMEEMVLAAKRANINFLRSSAYPERSSLYDMCDKYGIYVEECGPANFQRGTWDSKGDTQTRPASDIPVRRADFLESFAEMVERDKSHPSIIIYEYANESDWGVNFQADLDYLQYEDPTRLTAGTWDNTHTSIASHHYPEYNQIFADGGLYDEYAHIATHAATAVRLDPGIRNAWGLSIQKGWDAIYRADGVIGAAIFAMGDYTVQCPNGTVACANFGQWGLIDQWLRDKPEHYLTKKAYSPVKLPEKSVPLPLPGTTMAIPVENRFDNTSLSDVRFIWSAGDDAGECAGPDVAPGCRGALLLPRCRWENGEELHIRVLWKEMEIDEYRITVGEKRRVPRVCPAPCAAPSLLADDKTVAVSGKSFNITFDRASGQITAGEYDGRPVILGGPYLNLYGAFYKSSIFSNDSRGEFQIKPTDWKCKSFHCSMDGDKARIELSGTYPGLYHTDMWGFPFSFADIETEFCLRIDGDGTIETEYRIENPPEYPLYEVGVSYVLANDTDLLAWDRDAEYSAYPDYHIGRGKGISSRYRGYGKDTYRVKPAWNWAYDEVNYASYGGLDTRSHGTNDFIATREHIFYALAASSASGHGLRVDSDGASLSSRLSVAHDEDPRLPDGVKFTINDRLYYDLGNGSGECRTGDGFLGNYTYPEVHLAPDHSSRVTFRYAAVADAE